MANILDPTFWRRFSLAVHRDEEAQQQRQQQPRPQQYLERWPGSQLSTLTATAHPKHPDTWLARELHKRPRRAHLCWAFWLSAAALATTVTVVVLWFAGKKRRVHFGGH